LFIDCDCRSYNRPNNRPRYKWKGDCIEKRRNWYHGPQQPQYTLLTAELNKHNNQNTK
jgi:hypothetical protein